MSDANTPAIRKPLLIGGLIIICLSIIFLIYLNMPASHKIKGKKFAPTTPTLALVTPKIEPPTRVAVLPDLGASSDSAQKYTKFETYVKKQLNQDQTLSTADKTAYLEELDLLKKLVQESSPSLDPQLRAIADLDKQIRVFALQNMLLDQKKKMAESNLAITKSRVDASKLIGELQPAQPQSAPAPTTISTSLPSVDVTNLSSFRVSMIYGIDNTLQAVINTATKKYKVREGNTIEGGLFTIARITPKTVEIYSRAENKSKIYQLQS